MLNLAPNDWTVMNNDRVESLILDGLTRQLNLGDGVVKRLRQQNLLRDDEGGGTNSGDWANAVERLVDSGKILVYKINDLPTTFPLTSYSQSAYTTPEYLLGLLDQVSGDRAEEIRGYLEFQGVDVPKVRTAVTQAQKRRIDNAIRKLNEIRGEIADLNPENRVTWYLDGSWNFCLMVEPEGQMEIDQNYIAHSATLQASGGGDW
jgi:hypothetical protein